MSDAFSHYENAAVRALEAEEATEHTDQLAHLLLQAAGQGRREAAMAALAQGEIAQVSGRLRGEESRSTQFEVNTRVQQAVNLRNEVAFETEVTRLDTKLTKAERGKQKALQNLRPAYGVLKSIRECALSEEISNKDLGRAIRSNIVAMDYALD